MAEDHSQVVVLPVILWVPQYMVGHFLHGLRNGFCLVDMGAAPYTGAAPFAFPVSGSTPKVPSASAIVSRSGGNCLEAVTALACAANDHRRTLWMRGDGIIKGASVERIQAMHNESHALPGRPPAGDHADLRDPGQLGQRWEAHRRAAGWLAPECHRSPARPGHPRHQHLPHRALDRSAPWCSSGRAGRGG
jgi:hypothetical protein